MPINSKQPLKNMDTKQENTTNDIQMTQSNSKTPISVACWPPLGYTSEQGSQALTYADIPETKTYYPTLQEFQQPLMYIQSIKADAMQYGIIKIKPPSEWNPTFNLSWTDFRFETKIQPIHLIERRSATGSLSSHSLTNLRRNFILNLQTFLKDNENVDNILLAKTPVYLYDLYDKVISLGGYQTV